MPASSAGRANAPPDRACWAIAISCGLATTRATATASPDTASEREGRGAVFPTSDAGATEERRRSEEGRQRLLSGPGASEPASTASQPVATAAISTAPAIAPASSAVSWLISTETPSTTPSSTASRRRPERRSRTAAPSAAGTVSIPAAMFRWNQTCQSTMAARPYSAPAAIAPGRPSHSRAVRYIT